MNEIHALISVKYFMLIYFHENVRVAQWTGCGNKYSYLVDFYRKQLASARVTMKYLGVAVIKQYY